jgi:mRNA interferase HigB
MNRHILDELVQNHTIVLNPIKRWIDIVESSQWKSILDIWQCFPTADDVGNRHIVFDIKGNKYRIVTIVIFTGGILNIRWAGTHEEYDKIKNCSIL